MTAPNHSGAVAAENVRLMPPHPMGNTGISATQAAELGAEAAAAGLVTSAVTGMVHHIQEIAAEVGVRATLKTLRDVRRAHEAQLNTLMQRVRNLQPCPAPGGFLGNLNPNDALIRQGYVSRDAVLTEIRALMASSPAG